MADDDIRIADVLFNPVGLDVVDADEYVLIENTGPTDVLLTDWKLRDSRVHARGPYVYRFPRFILRSGQRVKVWTGRGQDNDQNLFWNRSWAVWNNTGDTAVLANSAGRDVSRFAYGIDVQSPGPRLRVMAWNIAEGIFLGDEMASLNEVARCIHAGNADIVLLNEVCRFWYRADQVLALATLAGYPYHHSERTSSKFASRGEKHVAVLSRFPLLFSERIQHSDPPSWSDRGGYSTLHVTVRIHDLVHHIFSTRFTAYDPAENAQSFATVSDFIKAIPPDEPVIIGGDFNAGYARYDGEDLPTGRSVLPAYADFHRQTGLRHVLGGIGWDWPEPDDHLLFRGPYSIARAERVPPVDPNPSDHPWVFAELAFIDGLVGVPLEDGSVLREPSNPAIYVVCGGAKIHIPDMATLQRLYGGLPAVRSVPDGSLAALPTVPCSGTILREENSPEVWRMEDGKRRHLVSPDVLDLYGGFDVVRVVPERTMDAITPGDNDTRVEPRSWAEYESGTIGCKPDKDVITFAIESNSAGVDPNSVEFVLQLGPGITWRKELVLVAGDGQRWTLVAENARTRDVNGLYRQQLQNGSLVLRKKKFPGFVWDVHTLGHLDQLRTGARVTFTWEKD